mmetsp:Transcript_6403/g.7491  ORF Transcript_6403/g.7491 Transcript_6403/m.7491 type:complete len:81 (-) Transcript_6403:9-251(-)
MGSLTVVGAEDPSVSAARAELDTEVDACVARLVSAAALCFMSASFSAASFERSKAGMDGFLTGSTFFLTGGIISLAAEKG